MSGSTKVTPAPPPPHASSGKSAAGEDSEEIMDYYLTNTSYYRQTMLSISTAAASVWRKQLFVNGAVETKEKLKMFWTNIGLVSALLLGVSYQSATNPITTDNPDFDAVASATAVFAGVSLVFSLAVIVVAIIYLIEIDNCTTERDLGDFIIANAPFVDGLTGVFSTSVVCLLVSAICNMYITYGYVEFLVVICAAGTLCIFGAVFAAIVAGHNRFRLWVRYSSPEGKRLIARCKHAEVDMLKQLKDELLFQIHELRDLKELLELKELKDRIVHPPPPPPAGAQGKGKQAEAEQPRERPALM